MHWIKQGFIYGPDGSLSWARHTALTPTPLLKDEETIRVYAGFRDETGISRIGYVDLDSYNPKRIKKVSQEPVLDLGRNGAFDDNGVILGDIIRIGSDIRMYYVGFQLVGKAKFLAFTGLAISRDNGDSFVRHSEAPVLDRSNNGLYIRAIHSVMQTSDRFLIWYACGNGWEDINGVSYPQYNIRYLESPDGIEFNGEGQLCVDVEGSEYRIGRPRVFMYQDHFIMNYTRGTIQGDYLAGHAESADGINWIRKDAELGIGLSPKGWDSRHLCYPAVLSCCGRTYMFYNGNDMGKDGFGYAILATDGLSCA